MAEFVKKRLAEKEKRILSTFTVYRVSKDKADFVDSLQRLFAKAQK